MERIDSIQYLRGFAALLVVAFHALESTPTQFPIGASGVDVFFVISGFIMASLMVGPESDAATFIWRRAIRIVPLYWATTLAAALVILVKPGFLYRGDASAENVLLSLAFVPHESNGEGVAPVLWQGWTLEYEVFFYVICSLSLLFTRRHAVPVMLVIILALAAMHPAHSNSPAGRVYTNPLLLEFAAGVFLALLWRRTARWHVLLAPISFAIGLGILTAQQGGLGPMSGIRVLDWGIAALFIVTGALAVERNGMLPRSKALLMLGDASYALYLTHGFVVSATIWVMPLSSPWVRLLVACSLSILLALLLHRWVERPLTHWLRAASSPRAPSPDRVVP
jgi:exopolysaccharide production protein ExoZ